ncbi:MAG TPA: DegV family protein [Coriobacteriia bacterium]|nr:DegV family protein [Coriobacteriia bacterium]
MEQAATQRPAFAVVTDSTSDITSAIAVEHGLGIVPLHVVIDGETFDDGALTQAEFFERMGRAPQLPTTAAPSIGELSEAYERALGAADEVVAVHISSRLSATFEAASLAARDFGGRVHVFDSRTLSWAMGWQVLQAAHDAQAGLDVASALRRLESARSECQIVVSIDSLENLRKGGRIGAVATALGSMLNLKVNIAVDDDGDFVAVGRSRGETASLKHVLDWTESHMGGARRGRFAIGHAMSPAAARRLADAIAQRWDAVELVIYEAGTAISAHAGTIWGVSFQPVFD